MTLEEWERADKSIGTKWRTPNGRIGRLVSVHKDGATLDFTDGETYTRVVRGFYRCVQLKIPQETDEIPKKPHSKERIKKDYGRGHKVYCTKNGRMYASVAKAATHLKITMADVKDACNRNIRLMANVDGKWQLTNLEWMR